MRNKDKLMLKSLYKIMKNKDKLMLKSLCKLIKNKNKLLRNIYKLIY